jgi:hypothetical protein
VITSSGTPHPVGFKNPVTGLTCVPDGSAGAGMITGRVLVVCLYRAAMYRPIGRLRIGYHLEIDNLRRCPMRHYKLG